MALPENYNQMSLQLKAKYLLDQGIEAKLDIDPDNMEPGYIANVKGVGSLPCGYHKTEHAAIDAGMAWLHSKAGGAA